MTRCDGSCQPAEGSQPRWSAKTRSAKTRSASGPSQYSDNATRLWVMNVTTLSMNRPGRSAATVPSGNATAMAIASDVIASVAETRKALPIWSPTGRRFVNEYPKSPAATLPIQLATARAAAGRART